MDGLLVPVEMILLGVGVLLVAIGLLPNLWSFGLYLCSRSFGGGRRGARGDAQAAPAQATQVAPAYAAPAQATQAAPAYAVPAPPVQTAPAQAVQTAPAYAAPAPPVQAAPAPATQTAPLSIAVLICARDEERVVGRCVRSVLAQDYPDFACFVVADGCTDGTAREARAAGAMVFERREEGPSTKGQALEYGVARVREVRDFDCICIFDSDNTLDQAFLSRVALSLERGDDAVSGLRLSSNAGATIVSSLYAAYWGMSQAMYAASHEAFGLNAPASGTGFAFRVDAWPAGWHTESIAEDCEMSVQLGLDGKRVGYDSAARCYDEQPEDLHAMIRQLRRWRTGCSHVAKAYARPVLAQFARTPSIASWDQLALLLEFVCTDALVAGVLAMLIAGVLAARLTACLGAVLIIYTFMLVVGISAVAECGQIEKHAFGTVMCYPLFLVALGVVGVSAWIVPCRQWNSVAHRGR